MTEEEIQRLRRRILRLGALLFQLRYYMADPADVSLHLYRYNATIYVRLQGERALIAADDAAEWVDLETAISRCKMALARGCLVHQV